MLDSKEEIILENGKYRFYVEDYCLKCARYKDKKWRTFIGNNAVFSLFARCLELEQKFKELEKK